MHLLHAVLPNFPTQTVAVRAASSGSADELKKAGESLQKAAGAAVASAADAVKNLKVPDMARLDVDIKKTVTYNFLAQLVLTAVSWGIAFITSHTTLAKVSVTWLSRCLNYVLNSASRMPRCKMPDRLSALSPKHYQQLHTLF